MTSEPSSDARLLSDPTTQTFDAVIVGGGPRGVATLIRIAARLGESARTADDARPAPLRIAIVDAHEVGPGATWTTAQPGQYLNNTTASATTIYPDESTDLSGPPSPGPTLVEWMDEVARAGRHAAGDWVAEEAEALRALDFTSRRLQGVYYRDQLEAAAAHPLIDLTEFTALAVDLESGDGDGAVRATRTPVDGSSRDDLDNAAATRVVLADGRRLSAPTIVLAQGMVQAVPDAQVRACAEFAADRGLRYVPPGMPAERDFSGLPAGETVLVRGLGANFFDVIGGLAEEWGGRFDDVPGDPHGRLRYIPSGREPRLVAGSRRGMPYRSKPVPYTPQRDYRPRWARDEWFAGLRARRNLDFAVEVWPTIAREIADQYLAALSEWAPETLRSDLRPDAAIPADQAAAWIPLLEECMTGEDVDRVLAEAVVDSRWNWTIADLRRPTRGEPISPEDWEEFVDRLITDELGSMSRAAVHPRAAVNRVMSVLRGPAQELGAVGAIAGDSLVRDLHGWFDADGLFLASGPPSERVRRVLALIEAGVIDLLGPETVIELPTEPDAGFRAVSAITGRTAEARVLLETRMSKGKVSATDDPLLTALLESGRARIHAIDGVPTDYIEATGALVSEDAELGHNLVDAAGGVDERIVVLGIPASTTQPGSAIGATPHKSSPLLAGADIAAKQIVLRAGRQPALRDRSRAASQVEPRTAEPDECAGEPDECAGVASTAV
ncbi:FAD-NAD(P)-binding protein [Brevibacterium sanguinis]|uniref:FAD-NAD(P)-binding protein n=2 Tax=Brevibacterium TaxID=1696 RepID=A0A366INZ3_9MICO|nr:MULTISPECIES: FAD/NAD(P)-binding protein [Brevibacterium]RBP67199.1 FAD-NAD(P)-binding protein [Brevibacterium sanguinis]RBP73724.1 FAD-NAD(P)-binding protein [Brevibacterium celere]